jgi:hypothetical protein
MPQRIVEDAMKAVADAQEQVIQDGGVIHEDAMWDANEMALDGASKESMVERLKQERAKPYVPKGRWVSR